MVSTSESDDEISWNGVCPELQPLLLGLRNQFVVCQACDGFRRLQVDENGCGGFDLNLDPCRHCQDLNDYQDWSDQRAAAIEVEREEIRNSLEEERNELEAELLETVSLTTGDLPRDVHDVETQRRMSQSSCDHCDCYPTVRSITSHEGTTEYEDSDSEMSTYLDFSYNPARRFAREKLPKRKKLKPPPSYKKIVALQPGAKDPRKRPPTTAATDSPSPSKKSSTPLRSPYTKKTPPPSSAKKTPPPSSAKKSPPPSSSVKKTPPPSSAKKTPPPSSSVKKTPPPSSAKKTPPPSSSVKKTPPPSMPIKNPYAKKSTPPSSPKKLSPPSVTIKNPYAKKSHSSVKKTPPSLPKRTPSPSPPPPPSPPSPPQDKGGNPIERRPTAATNVIADAPLVLQVSNVATRPVGREEVGRPVPVVERSLFCPVCCCDPCVWFGLETEVLDSDRQNNTDVGGPGAVARNQPNDTRRWLSYGVAAGILYGPLGRDNRRELPRCVVLNIRALFPDPKTSTQVSSGSENGRVYFVWLKIQ